MVAICGVTQDRKGLSVLRSRDEKVEFGEMRPLKEGQPISSDLVRLKPRAESPWLCDVVTEYKHPTADHAPSPSRAGPAQVATDVYRDNWDAIWARRSGVKRDLN